LPRNHSVKPANRCCPSRKRKKPALLETLKELVSIETGSRDSEGLEKLAGLIAGRPKEA
jgi:glutamate carboxypeptidase